MSYSFGLFFKQCESFEDGFNTALDVIDLLRKDYAEHIRNNVSWCPSINFDKLNTLADRYWLYELMSVTFVYFKEHNILAMSGYKYPDSVEKVFAGHVPFQNATDHDYELKMYPDEINLFKELKESVKDSTNESTVEEAMYDAVWDNLYLGDYVYRKDNDSFKIFSLSAMTDSIGFAQMSRELRKAVHERMEEEIEDTAELVIPRLNITEEVLESHKIKYGDKEFTFEYNGEENAAMHIAKQIVRKIFKQQGRLDDDVSF